MNKSLVKHSNPKNGYRRDTQTTTNNMSSFIELKTLGID